MLKDQFGNTLTTTSESARDAYVKGVDLFLAADAGVEHAFSEAISADNDPRIFLTKLKFENIRQATNHSRGYIHIHKVVNTLIPYPPASH